VLKVLFYNLRKVKLCLRQCASLVVKEVLVFWEKARIPVKDVQRCIDKLEKLNYTIIGGTCKNTLQGRIKIKKIKNKHLLTNLTIDLTYLIRMLFKLYVWKKIKTF